jgi:hypothetical protein
MLDIDRLLKYARPRKLTRSELSKLDYKTRAFAKRHGGSYVAGKLAQEFLEWFKSPHRTLWKMNWAVETVFGAAKAVKEATFAEYARKNPYTWMSVGKGRVKQNDWLLWFYLADNKVTEAFWLYVDFVVKISPKEKKFYVRDWPYHAVQVHPLSKYPTPPFRLSPQFCAALNRAVFQYSFEKIQKAKSDIPSAQLLSLVADDMRQ